MGVQVILCGKVNLLILKPKRKQVWKSVKSYEIDPKTGDLTMSKLKYVEEHMEGWTGGCYKILGRLVVGNEKL